MDLQEILSEVVRSTNEIFQAEAGSVALLEPATGHLVIKAVVGAGAQSLLGMRLPVSEGVMGWVATHAQPALIPETAQDRRFYGKIDQHTGVRTQSILCAPLKIKEQIIGVIELINLNRRFLNEDGLRILTVIASYAAQAIENARLVAQTRQQAEEQALLVEAMTIHTAELSLNTVLNAVSRQMIETLSADICLISRWDKTTEQLHSMQFYGVMSTNLLEQPRTVPPSPIQMEVLTSQKSQIVQVQVAELSTVEKKWAQQYHIESIFVVPLVYRRQSIGLIEIGRAENSKVIFPNELRLAEMMAMQAAVAIEHAHLFENLRAAEANYRDLFDNAYDLIFTLDAQFRVTSANKMALKSCGYQLNEAIGMHATRFIHPRHIPKLFGLLKTNLKSTEKPSTFELVMLSKFGHEMVLEVTMRVQRTESRPTGLHFIARDITQRFELEQRLRHGEKLSTIGQLVAGVAHELNNPLTSIIGYASLLQQSDLPGQYHHDLEVIFKQAKRAGLIVKDLLTFARTIELNAKPIDLNLTVQSSLTLMKSQLEQHHIQVTTLLDAAMPLTLADTNQLEQVFVNLITNASQALSSIPGQRELTVTTSHNNKVILVSVRDNGPGISELVLPQIFDPFFSTKQVGEGTGLGLSICYGIVTEHKGRIWAENNTPQGTTFFVELPWQPVESAKDATPEVPPDVPEADRVVLNVLVIDDEEFLLMLLQRVLNRMGHHAETTPNPTEAVYMLQTRPYDLVICDILLPNVTGPQIFEQTIAHAPELANKFIFITGNTVDLETRAFLDKTGAPWLAKPFLPADLARAIAQLIHSNQIPMTQFGN